MKLIWKNHKTYGVVWGNCGRGGQFRSPLPTFLKPFFNDVLNVCERSSEKQSCSLLPILSFLTSANFCQITLSMIFLPSKSCKKFAKKKFQNRPCSI